MTSASRSRAPRRASGRSSGRAASTGGRTRWPRFAYRRGRHAGGPPVREDRRHRIDPDRRRADHRFAQPRGGLLGAVSTPPTTPMTGSRSPPSPAIAAEVGTRLLVPGPRAGRPEGFRDGRRTAGWLSRRGAGRGSTASALLPPTAFLEPERADQLADRLSRSGINLVRLGDLDTPIGPDRSLFDDTRDDTKAFDPAGPGEARSPGRGAQGAGDSRGARAPEQPAVPRRGRRAPARAAAPGRRSRGPLRSRRSRSSASQSARGLLGRVNPETGLALRDDPALAWVTLLGEVSLFDLIDRPDDALPGEYAQRSADARAEEHGERHGPAVLAVAGVGPLQGDGRGPPQGQAAGADRRLLALAARARVRGRARLRPRWTSIDDRLFWAATSLHRPRAASPSSGASTAA